MSNTPLPTDEYRKESRAKWPKYYRLALPAIKAFQNYRFNIEESITKIEAQIIKMEEYCSTLSPRLSHTFTTHYITRHLKWMKEQLEKNKNIIDLPKDLV